MHPDDLKPRDERMRHVQLRYASLGFEFAAGIVGFVLLGYWADRSFGSSPIGLLVGAGLGFAGGMVHLVRRGKSMQDEVRRAERGDETGSGMDDGDRTGRS